MSEQNPTLLRRIVAGEVPTFAILSRVRPDGTNITQVLAGQLRQAETLHELSDGLRRDGGGSSRAVVVVPYGQVRERGYLTNHEDTPLVAIQASEYAESNHTELLTVLPDLPLELRRQGFDVDDAEYAKVVRDVIRDEIGAGEGANFVIHRSYLGRIDHLGVHHALTLLRRLIAREEGAHWTFAIALEDRYLVGASPELHISLDSDRTVRMNPISGTMRYGDSAPGLEEHLAFLSDTKEREELFMVVDEELKIMSRICDESPRVSGPFLREMSRLAHTEYFIEGPSGLSPFDILHESLLAPTVTGSPLENACRVIARHEPTSRQYYSGVAALLETTADGRASLDSTILIRTADLNHSGQVRIPVGATLVRHSDPDAEVAETYAKATAMLSALEDQPARYAHHPRIAQALRSRNASLARYWFNGTQPLDSTMAGCPRRVLIADYEDRFTDMLASQLSSIGYRVTRSAGEAVLDLDDLDLVVLGPGPGDPEDLNHGRIAMLHGHLRQVMASELPFLAICLSHQVLCANLGMEIVRLPTPNQGTQKRIDLFGDEVNVAFYNAFSAVAEDSELILAEHGTVRISHMPASNEVAALRAARFESFQFHPESLLSADGHQILAQVCNRLVTESAGALEAESALL
ncbi:MAG: 2-amino-4-deoxychorismate synthase [Pseudonocardiales bacterium]|jgi:phenazine biosynthesis protein phzE|nr:2-amino-4-deoxychorismate synthase [Pseudonocardiales bacterium]